MINIISIEATQLVKRGENEPLRLLSVKLQNDGAAQGVRIVCKTGEKSWETECRAETGESLIFVTVGEPEAETEVVARVIHGGGETEKFRLRIRKVRAWRFHLIQLSHHDVGYTALPSTVLGEQRRWLRDAVDMARETESYPEDARFRIVVEQAWSLIEFLRNTSREYSKAMTDMLRQGRFELTALFGNMTTELCGHETLVRALYPSFDLKRRYNIPVISAEHNDVPGLSWGVSQVLADSGIKLFCAGLPLYWQWTDDGLRSFWDQKKILGYEGPGAIWWRAPSGKRVLLWCSYPAGGDHAVAGPRALQDALSGLLDRGYPYAAVRWPVAGAHRDNACYSAHFCDIVRDWNAEYSCPRLTLSTNAAFYRDLVEELPDDLPVWGGDLPGPDYPVGATSTAAATAANRRNHTDLPKAEILSSAARHYSGCEYPKAAIDRAYEDVLWHDEHTWGHHFPAGPGARASNYEKAVHAFRAEALSHDLAGKAMGRIADLIQPPADAKALRLAVFNHLPESRGGVVRAAMRELDNCEIELMDSVNEATGRVVRQQAILNDRPHVCPEPDIIQGKFRLIEEESEAEVPFEIREIDGASSPDPYAAERVGLGLGTRRLGFMEDPSGLKYDLLFRAENVPGCGYRSYLLVPDTTGGMTEAGTSSLPGMIENEYFVISVDGAGTISSIVEKAGSREWVDPSCPHRMLEVITRSYDGILGDDGLRLIGGRIEPGKIRSSIHLDYSSDAHPRIRFRVDLFSGDPELHVAVRFLKSSEPLLDVFLCFPFLAEGASVAYEGTLCTLVPGEDVFPGAYCEDVTIQNWVSVDAQDSGLLWSSLDAPIVNLSALRRGYVSPAHRGIMHPSVLHDPPEAEDFATGWIYSHIFGNNFGTNFSVSQNGDALFRYVLKAMEPGLSRASKCEAGGAMTAPLEAIFAATDRAGELPTAGSALQIDPPGPRLLTWKRSEEDTGSILRLWNPGTETARSSISVTGFVVEHARLVSVCEEGTEEDFEIDSGSILAEIGPRSISTIFIPDDGMKRKYDVR